MAPCMLTSELTVHMLKYCKEGTFVVLSFTTLLLLLHSKLKKIQDLHRNLRTFQGLPLKFEVFSRLCRPCAIPNHFTISLIVKAGPHVTIATVSFSHVKTTYYFYVLRYHVLRKGTPGMSLVFIIIIIIKK